MMVKEAGMSFEPVISEMDLSYESRYKVYVDSLAAVIWLLLYGRRLQNS